MVIIQQLSCERRVVSFKVMIFGPRSPDLVSEQGSEEFYAPLGADVTMLAIAAAKEFRRHDPDIVEMLL